jgi:hypothetical protein
MSLTVAYIITIIFSGTATQRRLWPPCPQGFFITHDAPQLVELFWTSNQLVAETLYVTTNIHAPDGIQTQDRSRRAAADL